MEYAFHGHVFLMIFPIVTFKVSAQNVGLSKHYVCYIQDKILYTKCKSIKMSLYCYNMVIYRNVIVRYHFSWILVIKHVALTNLMLFRLSFQGELRLRIQIWDSNPFSQHKIIDEAIWVYSGDPNISLDTVFLQGINFKATCVFEPRREKTGLRGFRPGPTQTGLYKLRKEVEA